MLLWAKQSFAKTCDEKRSLISFIYLFLHVKLLDMKHFFVIILQFFQRIRNSNFAFYCILILNFSPKTFGIILALWTLIKKKMKFSSYIRKFKMEQLQSYIWLTASSYMGKNLRISSCIRKPFLIYDFATAPLWIALYMRKTLFSFLSVKFELC